MDMEDKNMDFNRFQSPPEGYGEVAFFWWQGDPITREKLTWILDQLEHHHISGLQINYGHSDRGGRSYGLTMESEPKPFTEEWWALVQWFQREAQRRGMTVSLSDYTLSTPGQESYTDAVLKRHPEYAGQLLVCQPDAEPMDGEYCDRVPLCRVKDGTIFRVCVPYSLNPMQPGVGEAIADAFYGAFERRMPGECGRGLNFFFSDELNFNVRGTLWCDDFPEEFQRRKGYELLPRLGGLFDSDAPGAVKTRLDYYDVVVQLSEERYFQPVYEWHQRRGMIFGCDHGGRGYDVTEFGDYFRAMRWYQGPGNDQPRLESDLIKSKVSSSVAHLYQRPRTWLEGFYSSGWQTSSADVADAIFRNFALGHNLLSLHGLYYSTHGGFWEWAPPCNHHHMPYWAEMDVLLGCVERLSWLLSQGRHCCDVAIVYPVAAVEADAVRGQEAVQCAFDAARFLYAHGVDFDFIDFQSVQRAEIADARLCVASEAYRTILLPSMRAVRYGMLDRLRAFAQAGGNVAVIGNAPCASDRMGENDPELDTCVSEILRAHEAFDSIEAFWADFQSREVQDILFPKTADAPYFQHRRIDGEDLYLIYRVPSGAQLGFRAKGKPVLLDPFSGKRYAVKNHRFDGTHTFVPMIDRFAGLMLLLFAEDTRGIEPLYEGEYQVIPFAGKWPCALEPTLDNAFGDYRLPVAERFIGAEARDLDYRYSDGDDWSHATYSYAPYLYVHRGTADDEELARLSAPSDAFEPYSFSMRFGVEGDAGYQGSYHGLKGRVSDDFIALGVKRITYAGSASEYEGREPYYVMGFVELSEREALVMESGSVPPEKIWIDHQPAALGSVTLDAGRHVVLLKYPHAVRTHFLLMKERQVDFLQEMPLAMRWYGNLNVVPYIPQPWNAGKACQLRLIAPPGTRAIVLPGDFPAEVLSEGRAWRADGRTLVPETPLDESEQIVLRVPGEKAILGAALLSEPIRFLCGRGVMDVDAPIETQGLKHYSGGVRYIKTVRVDELSRPVLLRFNALDCSARIWINGCEAGVLVAPPYETEITRHLRVGENQIEVLIHNTLRNHMRTIPTNFLFEKEIG